jgi:hypothetical protein
MDGAVEGFAGKEAGGVWPRQVVRDPALVASVASVAAGIERGRSLDLIEPPVGQRL